jgi:predicted amidohydrolase
MSTQTSTQAHVRVAAIQMVSTPDPMHNRRVVEGLVRQAAAGGAELILLP